MEQIKLTDQLSKHLLKDATLVFATSSLGLLYDMPEVNASERTNLGDLEVLWLANFYSYMLSLESDGKLEYK